MNILYSLYYFLSFLLWPVFVVILKIRDIHGKEISARIPEKKGVSKAKRPDAFLVMIHGASIGETQALRPVINSLLKDYPEIVIMLTSGTRSSAEILKRQLAEKEHGERVFHHFLPLDHPVWVNRFLRHWKPDLILWSESDFWPNIIMQAKSYKIPQLLINGRMSPKSFKKWKKLRGLFKSFISVFKEIHVQKETDRLKLIDLGAKTENISLSGNLKFSSPVLKSNKKDLNALRKDIGARPFWCYASCHPDEFKIAIKTHEKLKKDFPNIISIIVPRHPEKKTQYSDLLIETGLTATYRSDAQSITDDTGFYIADSFGELGLFYDLSDIIMVGGSLINLGCHNVIEPVQQKSALLFGSYIYNIEDTCLDLIDKEAGIQVHNGTDLAENIKLLLLNPTKTDTMKNNGYGYVMNNANVLNKTLKAIKKYIKK